MNRFKLKDYNVNDTIAAIATFPSKSALGVIKISGKKAIAIVSKIFQPKSRKNLRRVKNFTLHYGFIKNNRQASNRKPKTDNIIDEVLLSVMRKPNSYTKEDVLEISSHGGIVVLNKILQIILKQGARLAMPGEFTYRAFINGRIDLLQAQSIFDIVEARSEKGLELAINQLNGRSSKQLQVIKDELKDIFIQTETFINFPEDQVYLKNETLKTRIENIQKKIVDILSGSNEAKALNEGLRCVICGKANVGKSTLFNCLLKEERVIVSSMAGTTRDVVEETIIIKGVPLRIYDTAGIIEPKDFITKKAIEKSASIFAQADLVILVMDNSRRLGKDDLFFLDKLKDKQAVIVINKIDRKPKLDLSELAEVKCPKVKLSILKKTGIDKLENAVHNYICRKGIDRENLIFLSTYQKDILGKAQANISQALGFLKQGYTFDFVNLALKEGLENLGKLTGEVYCEEILKSIFSNFCIGK